MLGFLIAAVLTAPADQTATRFDVAQRLLAMDYQWMAVPDKTRHVIAVDFLIPAVNAFLQGDLGSACKSLDAAHNVLTNRPPTGGDAITIRFSPPYAEPKGVASLKVTWAYSPADRKPVRIAVGSQSIFATPGRDLTIDVHPEQVVPELNQSPEAGVLVPVSVGDESRSAYLNVVKGLKIRAKGMLTSLQPEAQFLATRVLALADDPTAETERPLIQMLFTAEILDEGRQRLDQIEEMPLVHQGATDFRIAFPSELKGKTNVSTTLVIGLHGAGGTENMFFDAYGHGRAAREALDRGWVFASPQVSTTAVGDVLSWIRNRRHLKVARVFLMGHSMGASVAVASAASTSPRPAALALFSPAVRTLPTGLADTPVYMAYARQDLPALLPAMQSLATELNARKNSKAQELGACEHLTCPADAIPFAYRFFDSVSSKSSP